MRCRPWAADGCGGGEGVYGGPEDLADRLESTASDDGERVNREDGSPCRGTTSHLGHSELVCPDCIAGCQVPSAQPPCPVGRPSVRRAAGTGCSSFIRHGNR